ncbi:MAG TPA: TIGR01459 family HAD-type hydrolase [Rhizomicrobium sp.]|jgi:HAD superfamily hydrolase (TIGR01459 family)
MNSPLRPALRGEPAILSGLGAIADSYDALFCDVWGVLHDGSSARAPAVEALRRFRALRGPVILLSNAPRPAKDVEEQFARLRVPADCYDEILTSGMLARDDLARRADGRELPMLHIGPERDSGVFVGLPVRCVGAADAEIVLCTGLFDDDTEAPEDYRGMLEALKARDLTLLCANPDIVVQRGGQLVWCAGALARLYDEVGGISVYYGKPHLPIYAAALARARALSRRAAPRVLVLGDGLETDIRGANEAALDAVFIADGIHGEDIREMTPEAIGVLCNRAGVTALSAIRALVW